MAKENFERITAWVADKKALRKLALEKKKTASELIRIALKKTFNV